MLKYSYLIFLILACSQTNSKENLVEKQVDSTKNIVLAQNPELESVVFAMGCFWCVEEIFEKVKGVEEVVSGYAGGNAKTANYKSVASGITAHVEAVEIFYNPKEISFDDLLLVYFNAGDITQKNGQGADRGTQYSSVLFYKNNWQKKKMIAYIERLKKSKQYKKGIAVKVKPFSTFVTAEDYHQDFVKKNPNQSYVRAVSKPRCNNALAKIPKRLLK